MSIQIAKVREFKGHTQAIYTLCRGVSADTFFSAGADRMIVEWNVEQNDGTLFAKTNAPVYTLLNSGTSIICGCNDGTVVQFDIASKSVLSQIRLYDSPVFDIAAFGEYFIIAFENGCIGLTDCAFNLVKQLRISAESLRKMLIVDEGILITGKEGIVWLLDKTLQPVSQFSADDTTVFSIAQSPDKKFLLTGGRSAVLKIWEEQKIFSEINAHWYHIKDIAYNPSGDLFTTCSMDKTIKLWDASNFGLLKVIDFEKYEAHRSSVNKILWIGINRFISCSDDRTILCFEIRE